VEEVNPSEALEELVGCGETQGVLELQFWMLGDLEILMELPPLSQP
jgi:hypothetical protein